MNIFIQANLTSADLGTIIRIPKGDDNHAHSHGAHDGDAGGAESVKDLDPPWTFSDFLWTS